MSQKRTFRAAWPDEYRLINRLFAPPWQPAATIKWLVASVPGPRERVVAMATLAWQPQDAETVAESAQLYWRTLPRYQSDPEVIEALITAALSTGVDSHISECGAYRMVEAGGFEHGIPNREEMVSAIDSRLSRINLADPVVPEALKTGIFHPSQMD